MGELRKQFKEQTGNNCATTIKGEPAPTWSYVTWLESRTPANEAVCEWKEDDIDGKWDTACGESHSFESGGPEENGHKFCPYCGRKLQPSELNSCVHRLVCLIKARPENNNKCPYRCSKRMESRPSQDDVVEHPAKPHPDCFYHGGCGCSNVNLSVKPQ